MGASFAKGVGRLVGVAAAQGAQQLSAVAVGLDVDALRVAADVRTSSGGVSAVVKVNRGGTGVGVLRDGDEPQQLGLGA